MSDDLSELVWRALGPGAEITMRLVRTVDELRREDPALLDRVLAELARMNGTPSEVETQPPEPLATGGPPAAKLTLDRLAAMLTDEPQTVQALAEVLDKDARGVASLMARLVKTGRAERTPDGYRRKPADADADADAPMPRLVRSSPVATPKEPDKSHRRGYLPNAAEYVERALMTATEPMSPAELRERAREIAEPVGLSVQAITDAMEALIRLRTVVVVHDGPGGGPRYRLAEKGTEDEGDSAT